MKRFHLLCGVVLLVLSGGVVDVGAQEVTLAESLGDVDTGTSLRIHLSDGRLLEGDYSGTAGDRLVLLGDAGPEFFALDDVTTMWQRGRATKRGAVYGAWVTGIAFAVYGALFEMVVEYDNGVPVTGILVGGSFGAASGALAGGVIGSAVPQWHRRWGEDVDRGELPEPAMVGASPVESSGPSLGLAAFGLGLADPVDGRSSHGMLVTGSLTGSLGERFRHGVDLMLAQDVEAQPEQFQAGVYESYRGSSSTIWSAGWRFEWSYARPHGSVWDPFMVVGAGAYGWIDTYLGVNYGLGLRWTHSGGGSGAFVELRRHDNIQNLVETDPTFVTVSAGISSSW